MMTANWNGPKPAKTIMDMNVEELKAEKTKLAKLLQTPQATSQHASRYNMVSTLRDSLWQAKVDALGYLDSLNVNR